LLVLFGRERTAVPRVVGDVDEQRRLGKPSGKLAAERVFVADIDGNALAVFAALALGGACGASGRRRSTRTG